MDPNKPRPNVLFIMSDQHRFDYLGCAGADFVQTPNLDRIAARGVRLTQCTTNSPVCAPSRIALATGLQPYRLGALDNNSFLPGSAPTHYQHFRDHGYRVGCVGKLDLAKPDKYNGRYGDRPCIYGWGFTHPEECEGKMHAGLSPTPVGPYTYFLQERGL
jgi:choline-sulfatase